MKLGKVLEWAEKNGLDIQCADEYAEPGYTKDHEEAPILLANWNRVEEKDPEMNEAIEAEFNIEWEDEWTTCGDCGKLVRTSGDSYSWKPYYAILNDCEVFCGDCIKKNPSEYLESLINNPSKADIFDLDLEKEGFTKLDARFENGFYGSNDNPKIILENLQKEFPGNDFIFGNLEPEQFRTNFSIYKREKAE